MTKLQVAVDLLTTADALALAHKVADHVDVIELGTPLIKCAGMSVISAIKAAHPDKEILADLIGVTDRIERAREVTKLGVAFVELHAGLDEQAQPGYSILTLIEDAQTAGVPFAIAGGINVDTIAAVRAAGAHVAVAGGAIYGAADPAAAARSLQEALVN